MVSLLDKLKNQLREELVRELYHHHRDVIEGWLDIEQVVLGSDDEIMHWLSKNIWANNVSVKRGQHLRLSAEGRHLFDLLVEERATSKSIQPIEKDLFNDHQLWIEMNRKCPVPWFLIPNISIDHRNLRMTSQHHPIQTAGSLRGAKSKDRFRVEFYDYGDGSMQLTLMSTIGDLKKWVKFLD